MNESRIYVRLSQEEFNALYNAAARDYRRPADQARAILRRVLIDDQEKHNDALKEGTYGVFTG
jgi:hypothetical protein